MAKYKSFSLGQGSVLVEVEEGESGGGGGNLKDSLSMLQELIRSFADVVSKLPQKHKPGEFKLTFGLKTLEDGSFAIPADPEQGNFRLKMTWSAAPSGDEMLGTGFD